MGERARRFLCLSLLNINPPLTYYLFLKTKYGQEETYYLRNSFRYIYFIPCNYNPNHQARLGSQELEKTDWRSSIKNWIEQGTMECMPRKYGALAYREWRE